MLAVCAMLSLSVISLCYASSLYDVLCTTSFMCISWLLSFFSVDQISYRTKLRLHDMHADTPRHCFVHCDCRCACEEYFARSGSHINFTFTPFKIFFGLIGASVERRSRSFRPQASSCVQSFRCPSTWMPMTMGATGLDLLPSVLIPQR